MNNWFSAEVEVQRRREEAAAKGNRYHTLEPFWQRRPHSIRRYQRLLVYLGAKLESWGCRLQARYSAMTLPADGPYLSAEQYANQRHTEPCSG